MGQLTIVFCDYCKKTKEKLTKQFTLIDNDNEQLDDYKVCGDCFIFIKTILDTVDVPDSLTSISGPEPDVATRPEPAAKKTTKKTRKKAAKKKSKKKASNVKKLHDGEYKVPSNAGLVNSDVLKSFGSGCKHEKKSYDPEEGGLLCKTCGEKLAMI